MSQPSYPYPSPRVSKKDKLPLCCSAHLCEVRGGRSEAWTPLPHSGAEPRPSRLSVRKTRWTVGLPPAAARRHPRPLTQERPCGKQGGDASNPSNQGSGLEARPRGARAATPLSRKVENTPVCQQTPGRKPDFYSHPAAARQQPPFP